MIVDDPLVYEVEPSVPVIAPALWILQAEVPPAGIVSGG
jgi:hypothetical protein